MGDTVVIQITAACFVPSFIQKGRILSWLVWLVATFLITTASYLCLCYSTIKGVVSFRTLEKS